MSFVHESQKNSWKSSRKRPTVAEAMAGRPAVANANGQRGGRARAESAAAALQVGSDCFIQGPPNSHNITFPDPSPPPTRAGRSRQ